MARIYQKKSKFKQGNQREELEQDHTVSEHQGLHHAAVPVAYSNTPAIVPAATTNPLQKKESEKKDGQVDSPYQYHVPRQFAAVPPVQGNFGGGTKSQSSSSASAPLANATKISTSAADDANDQVCKVSDEHLFLQEKHRKIQKGLLDNDFLINEGSEQNGLIFGVPYKINKTPEYIQTQLLIQQEDSLYDKLSLKEEITPGDPDLRKFETVESVLQGRILTWDAMRAELKKIDAKAIQSAIAIHDSVAGAEDQGLFDTLTLGAVATVKSALSVDLNKLYRSLQSSFPFKEKRDDYFRQYFKMETYDFIRSKILTTDKGIPWSMAQAYLVAGKLRPVDKFYIAVTGWGTDEGNVFFSMKEAYAYGVDKIEEDLKGEYQDAATEDGVLPITGALGKKWKIAGRIDSDCTTGGDDNIKAKALLCYGRVRPIDEIRMAVSSNTSKSDLKNALRKANVENLEIVLSENSDKCLTPEAERKKVNQKLLEDYKFSYGSDLMDDIRMVFTTTKSNYDGDEVQSSTTYTEVDEKGLGAAMNIAEGRETKMEQYLDEKTYDKKLSIATFFNMNVVEKKIFLDTFSKYLFTDSLRQEFNQLVGIWELEIVNEPIYKFIKSNQLFDKVSFDNFVKYSIDRRQFLLLGKHLQSEKSISDISANTYEYLNDYFLKGSQLLWTYRYIGSTTADFFQHVVNSKDKNWLTNFIMNVLNASERKYYAYYWKDLFYSSVKDAQTNDNFDHIQGLLNDDPTIRIVAERKLLNKANSGLGAAITNIGSTSGLSAENEQRELEVDLEMSLSNDGVVDKAEQANIEKGIVDAQETRANFEDVRNTVEGVATMIAQTLVVVAASALIPGSAPLLAKVILGGMVGAAGKVATNAAMKGQRYSVNEALKDVVTGGVDGAFGAVAAFKVAEMAKGGGKFGLLLARNKIIKEVTEEALGNVHSFGIDMANGEGFKGSLSNYFTSVGTGVAIGKVTDKFGSLFGKGRGSQKAYSEGGQSDVPPDQLPTGQDPKLLGPGEGDTQGADSKSDKADSESSNNSEHSKLENGQSHFGNGTGSAVGTGSSEPKAFDVSKLSDSDLAQILRDAGSWDRAIDKLEGIEDGDKVIRQLVAFRNRIVAGMQSHDAEPLGEASTEDTSDSDVQVKPKEGPNGDLLTGRKLLDLETSLAKKFGVSVDEVKRMFKMDFYVHSGRLEQYLDIKSIEGLPKDSFEDAELRITDFQDRLALARMLYHAQGDPALMPRIESMIHGRSDEGQIRELAKNPENPKLREKFLLAGDRLQQRLLEPNLSPKQKAALLEQVTKMQSLANFYSREAYLTASAFKSKSTHLEFHGAMMGQLDMFYHKMNEYRGKLDMYEAYDCYKYIFRFLDALKKRDGKLDPQLDALHSLSEAIYQGERDFYKSVKKRSPEELSATFDIFHEHAQRQLAVQLDKSKIQKNTSEAPSDTTAETASAQGDLEAKVPPLPVFGINGDRNVTQDLAQDTAGITADNSEPKIETAPKRGSDIDNFKYYNDPISKITDTAQLSLLLSDRITEIDVEIDMVSADGLDSLAKSKKLQKLEAKRGQATSLSRKIKNNSNDRQVLYDTQQFLIAERNQRALDVGEEIELHDIPADSEYLQHDSKPFTTIESAKSQMIALMQENQKFEYGLWKDNSKVPPIYRLIQGTTFSVPFSEYGIHLELVAHSHPNRGLGLLDMLPSLADFQHIIGHTKQPKVGQKIDSEILLNDGLSIRRSKFYAEYTAKGWEFSVMAMLPSTEIRFYNIDANIILTRNEHALSQLYIQFAADAQNIPPANSSVAPGENSNEITKVRTVNASASPAGTNSNLPPATGSFPQSPGDSQATSSLSPVSEADRSPLVDEENPSWDDDKTPPMGTKLPAQPPTKQDRSMYAAQAGNLVGKDGTITLYHGSVKSFSLLQKSGFNTSNGGATYLTTDRSAAMDAISAERVELETKSYSSPDAGLIEIKLTLAQYLSLLETAQSVRAYGGFHGANISSMEILISSPENINLVNGGIVR